MRGVKRFYLDIPNTHNICFISDDPGGGVTYHIVDMDTDRDIAIHAPSSPFGRSIGMVHCDDTVVGFQNESIILTTVSNDARSTLPELKNLASTKWVGVLNVTSRRIVSQKTIYLDRDGKVLMEYDESPPR